MNTPDQNRIHAAARVADKRRRAESAAAVQAATNLPPEYLDKLKHDCLVAATLGCAVHHPRMLCAKPPRISRRASLFLSKGER
jgi:hypothetical protein